MPIAWILNSNVDWHEKYRFAKVAFPFNLKSAYATYEIPFGAIQRFDWTLKADPGVKLPGAAEGMGNCRSHQV